MITDENILCCIKTMVDSYERSVEDTTNTIEQYNSGTHRLSGESWFLKKMEKQLDAQKRGIRAIKNMVSSPEKVTWVMGLNMPDLTGMTSEKTYNEKVRFINHYEEKFGKDKTAAKTDELRAELDTLFFIYYNHEPAFKD